MIDIIANIEAIRQEKGIKQSEMGRRLGTTQSGYSNFVNRNTDMPFSRISQIADILGFYQSTIAFYIKSSDNFEQIKQLHAKNNKTKKFISLLNLKKK